jgi:hypothetical protein
MILIKAKMSILDHLTQVNLIYLEVVKTTSIEIIINKDKIILKELIVCRWDFKINLLLLTVNRYKI